MMTVGFSKKKKKKHRWRTDCWFNLNKMRLVSFSSIRSYPQSVCRLPLWIRSVFSGVILFIYFFILLIFHHQLVSRKLSPSSLLLSSLFTTKPIVLDHNTKQNLLTFTPTTLNEARQRNCLYCVTPQACVHIHNIVIVYKQRTQKQMIVVTFVPYLNHVL